MTGPDRLAGLAIFFARLVDKVNATGHLVKGCNNSYKRTVAVRPTNGVTWPLSPMGGRGCIYSCKNYLQLFNPTEKIEVPASAVNEMVVMTMAKNKHLVNEERSQIEHLLRNGKSIKEIAR
ncbi:MAG: helix-turn-helix domain-containing protein, partial [Dethiobacteria bacterium]